ncbi:hypothetical protein EDD21DRAFT_386737 [Dissophora ornata]|nr:hypothetical protein EDD21DRAFT_386737 [Dissophora ornata]
MSSSILASMIAFVSTAFPLSFRSNSTIPTRPALSFSDLILASVNPPWACSRSFTSSSFSATVASRASRALLSLSFASARAVSNRWILPCCIVCSTFSAWTL